MLLEAGGGLVTLKKVAGADGRPDLEAVLDRNLVSTLGQCLTTLSTNNLPTENLLEDADGLLRAPP